MVLGIDVGPLVDKAAYGEQIALVNGSVRRLN